MDTGIFLILLQDGIVGGTIYALLALSLVLVFTVTRVILLPAGEVVAYGALSYSAFSDGRVPGSVWLLCALGVGAFITGLWAERRMLRWAGTGWLAVETLLVPLAVTGMAIWLGPQRSGVVVAALLSVAVVAPMLPYVHRIAFQALAEASMLVLLIAAVGVHLAMVGLGLVFFGPEGYRAPPFSDTRWQLGEIVVPGQAIWVIVTTAVLVVALVLFFNRTLSGKALQATAINGLGARLVGISTARSGRIAFLMAGVIGTVSGVLIAPLTTVYYDSGFLIGLKGFVAAIIGGLVSYPVAFLAALAVGCIESFSSFWFSAFKEVIVFTAIIPVLLWRSLHGGNEEE